MVINIKYLTLTLVMILFSNILMISCREVAPTNPSKDVVEDLDDILQKAEDDVKKVIKKDSTHSDKTTRHREFPNRLQKDDST